MRKNSHGRILKEEPKKQYLNTVSKSYSYIHTYMCIYIYVYIYSTVSVFRPAILISTHPSYLSNTYSSYENESDNLKWEYWPLNFFSNSFKKGKVTL